jgi:hypothetical protein
MSHCITQAGIELLIIRPQPGSLDHRCVSPHLALIFGNMGQADLELGILLITRITRVHNDAKSCFFFNIKISCLKFLFSFIKTKANFIFVVQECVYSLKKC